MDTIETLGWLFEQVRQVNTEPMPQPGLARDEIVSAFREIDIAAPEPLITLYAWHNGIYHLNAFLHFPSLTDALSTYRNYKEFKDEYADFKWMPTWFPVLDMNGDVQLCVDVHSGELIAIDMECDTIHIVAGNYGQYVRAVEELFRSGAYTFNEVAGVIEAVPSVWRAIAEKNGIRDTW